MPLGRKGKNNLRATDTGIPVLATADPHLGLGRLLEDMLSSEDAAESRRLLHRPCWP